MTARDLFFYLCMVMFPGTAISESLTPIQLTAAQEIMDIEQLDAAVSSLTIKMKQCAAAGLAPMPECHCRYPLKLEVTKTTLNRILNKYPQWQNRAVLWWNSNGAMASNLHLGGVSTRLGQPCHHTELSLIGAATDQRDAALHLVERSAAFNPR